MEIVVRPLTHDDLEAARDVQFRSFDDYDRRHGAEGPPVTPHRLEQQAARFRHFLDHDRDGSWVAVVDDVVVGTALALRRDSLWGLSLLAVDPASQSQGIGRRLLDASLTYAQGAATAVILSSEDPRAMRAYAAAGFDLHPQVRAGGAVDRARLPGLPRVRAGDASWDRWADGVDDVVRGAARGPDHVLLNSQGQMFVVDDVDGRGYAYVRSDGRIVTLAATDETTATELLWACLATDHDGERAVEHVNGDQQWAVRVAVAARLRLKPGGPAFWRGRRPPLCFLPSGAYL